MKRKNKIEHDEDIKKSIGLFRLLDKKTYIEKKKDKHQSWANNFILFVIGLIISVASGQLRWLGLIMIGYGIFMIVDHKIRKFSYSEVHKKAESYYNKIKENREIPNNINDFVDDLTEETKQINMEVLDREGFPALCKKMLSESINSD